MHISRAGEYGVLGLLHLARQPGGQPVMIDAVSRDEAIPKSFLAKIFQDLAKAGVLRSQRGSGGGFTGLASGRESPDLSPDYVFQSKGRVTADGYEVEVRIPFKSLRYKAASADRGNVWKINFVRTKIRGFETNAWSPVPSIYRPLSLASSASTSLRSGSTRYSCRDASWIRAQAAAFVAKHRLTRDI